MRPPRSTKLETRVGITLPDVIAIVLMMSVLVGMLVIASHWFDPPIS